MMEERTLQVSHVLTECADFYQTNPRAYTDQYVSLRNGQRCTYLDPQADQWDMVGIIGKILWEKYGFRTELTNLWVFKRMSRAFKEANQIECDRLESPFFVYEIHYETTVIDIIDALRKAAEWAKLNDLDEPLRLEPITENIQPLKLFI
jgi:hypothetical protein